MAEESDDATIKPTASKDAVTTKLDLATQVRDDDETTTSEIGTARSSCTGWPVRPTAEAASEFKISPAVHAGYAQLVAGGLVHVAQIGDARAVTTIYTYVRWLSVSTYVV